MYVSLRTPDARGSDKDTKMWPNFVWNCSWVSTNSNFIFLLTIWNLYHEFWGDKENFFLILKFTWNLRTENTEFLVSNVSMFYFHEFCKNFQRKEEVRCIQE